MTQAPKPAKRFTGNSRCKGIRFVFGFRPPFWQRVRRVLPPSCPESFLRYTAFHLPAFRGAIHKAVMPIVGLLTCPPKTDPQVMLEWWIEGRQRDEQEAVYPGVDHWEAAGSRGGLGSGSDGDPKGLVLEASITSKISTPIRRHSIFSSFTKAMFTAR